MVRGHLRERPSGDAMPVHTVAAVRLWRRGTSAPLSCRVNTVAQQTSTELYNSLNRSYISPARSHLRALSTSLLTAALLA